MKFKFLRESFHIFVQFSNGFDLVPRWNLLFIKKFGITDEKRQKWEIPAVLAALGATAMGFLGFLFDVFFGGRR